MLDYYINRNQQPNGDYEVHRYGCDHGALPANQVYLGKFNNGVEAVAAAKQRFPNEAATINGCAYCNPEANTDR